MHAQQNAGHICLTIGIVQKEKLYDSHIEGSGIPLHSPVGREVGEKVRTRVGSLVVGARGVGLLVGVAVGALVALHRFTSRTFV